MDEMMRQMMVQHRDMVHARNAMQKEIEELTVKIREYQEAQHGRPKEAVA